MRSIRERASLLVALGVIALPLAGQESSAAASASPAARTFDFIARFQGGQPMKGSFTIHKDSVAISPKIGHCRPLEPGSRSSGLVVFRCEGVLDVDNLIVTIDRLTPSRSSWRGTVQRSTQVQTSKCATPILSAAGKQVGCAKYVVEPRTTDERVGDQLQVVAR